MAILLAWASAPALGADAADPERLAEARAVLALMHVERQMDEVSGVMADAMAKQLSQGKSSFNQRAMQITLEETMRGVKDQVPGLVDAMAGAYASQFTFAELRQMREFYQSPAGQHLLQAAPEVMKQVLPRMMEMSRASLPRTCARAKERMLAEKIESAEKMTCPESK